MRGGFSLSIIARLKGTFNEKDVKKNIEKEKKNIKIRYDICLKDGEKISGITSGYKKTDEFRNAILNTIIKNGTLTVPFDDSKYTYLVNSRSIACVKYQEVVGSDECGKDKE